MSERTLNGQVARPHRGVQEPVAPQRSCLISPPLNPCIQSASHCCNATQVCTVQAKSPVLYGATGDWPVSQRSTIRRRSTDDARRPVPQTICCDRQRQEQRADNTAHGRAAHGRSFDRLSCPGACAARHAAGHALRWLAGLPWECASGDVTDHVKNEQLYSTTCFLPGNGCFRR